MSVLKRRRKSGVVYLVCTKWKGRRYYENVGGDRREADRVNKRRRGEVKAGTFTPQKTSAATVRSYTNTWLDGRKNRNADNDASIIRRLVLSRKWLADMQIEDVRKPHALRLLDELRATKSEETSELLSEKYIGNVMGLMCTMYNEAEAREIVQSNPFKLQRGTLQRQSEESARTIYELGEIARIVGCQELSPMARMFAALAFLTGMREGEVCGRRWRDWDEGPEPLTCLTVASQYNDRKLKTEWGRKPRRPRRVPVHPDLERLLRWWQSEGFALQYARSPTPDDFIVPQGDGTAHTRSSAYKMWRRALAKAGVSNRTLHATRHSFITHCRRGGAPKDVVAKITHNAKGDIVDQYTHELWGPMCNAVLCLNARTGATRRATGARKALPGEVEAQGIEVSGRDDLRNDSAIFRGTPLLRSASQSSEEFGRSGAGGGAGTPFEPNVPEHLQGVVIVGLEALSGDNQRGLFDALVSGSEAIDSGKVPEGGGR